MTKKHFYTTIVNLDIVYQALSELDLAEDEKEKLNHLIDTTLHHTVLDAVLSELSEEDKKIFLQHVAAEKHEEIWQLLNRKVVKIEEKIKQAADSLAQELHKDIQEVKP